MQPCLKSCWEEQVVFLQPSSSSCSLTWGAAELGMGTGSSSSWSLWGLQGQEKAWGTWLGAAWLFLDQVTPSGPSAPLAEKAGHG